MKRFVSLPSHCESHPSVHRLGAKMIVSFAVDDRVIAFSIGPVAFSLHNTINFKYYFCNDFN